MRRNCSQNLICKIILLLKSFDRLNTSSSRIDEQLRQIQENTKKYEDKLSVSIEDWEQYIKNWEMPKQNIKELYKVGSFEFKRDYRIKISENTYSIGSKT